MLSLRAHAGLSMPTNAVPRKKVAIVGSGCSGIAALWALSRTHHDVYLYEAADRLGGRTNTADWHSGKYTAKVDTGFIVMNSATYREKTPLFALSSMSLGALSRLGRCYRAML